MARTLTSMPAISVVDKKTKDSYPGLRRALGGDGSLADDLEYLIRKAKASDEFLMEGASDLIVNGVKGQIVDGVHAFFDITGFTAYTDRLVNERGERAGESVAAAVDELLGPIVEVIHAYGGRVDKYAGDSVMALFGGVEQHEDDDVRVLEAALRIRDVVREMHDETGFEITSGIERGTFYLGKVGADERFDYTSIGDSVNIAAKLEKLCTPWEILVGGSLASRAGDKFLMDEVTVEIPKLGDVVAYKLLGKRDPDLLKSVSLDVFLTGRSTEVSRLLELLRSVRDENESCVVSMSGVAGIGKSRLIDYTRQNLDGLCYFEAVGSTMRRHIPFGMIIDMFAKYVPSGDLRYYLVDGLGMNEEEYGFLGTLLGREDTDVSGYRHHVIAVKVADAVLSFFENFKKKTGNNICVVFDDLQWADRQSVQVMKDFASRAGEGTGVVFAYRPEFDDELAADRHFELHSLDKKNSKALVENILAQTSDNFDTIKIDGIIERSEGVPFFLETGAKALMRGDDAVTSEERDLLISEVDRVGTRRVMQAAAMLGREFDINILKKMSPMAARIDPFVNSGIVRIVDKGRYRFDHILRVEALAGSLSDLDAAELHLRAALAYNEVLDDDFFRVDDVVHHLEEVEERLESIGKKERDVLGIDFSMRKIMRQEAYSEAARRKTAVGAYTDAALLLDRAAEIEGDMNRKLDWYVRAANLGERFGDVELLREYWIKAANSIEARIEYHDGIRVKGCSPEASRRSSYRLHLLNALGLMMDGDFETAIDEINEAKKHAEYAGDESYMSRLFENEGRAAWHYGMTSNVNPDGFFRHSIECYTSAYGEDYNDYSISGALNLVLSLIHLGEVNEALKVIKVAEDKIRDSEGWEVMSPLKANFYEIYAACFIRSGDIERAERYVSMAEGIARRFGMDDIVRYCKADMAEVRAASGDIENARLLYDEVIKEADAGGNMYNCSDDFRKRKNLISA